MTDSSVHADACVQRGFQLQGADDVAGAEAAYLQALDHCAEHPVALQLLGGLLRRRGDVVRAETMMRRSLQADATQPHVWNNLGNLLQSLSRLGEAEASFDQALALAPGFAEGHYNRARVLQQQGRSAQAAAASQQAFKYAPKPTAAMLQLQSQIEDSQGQPDAALATLDRALQLAPGRPALHHNRATLLQRQQQHSAALLAHEQAFALGLDHADAHYNHGNTLQSLYRPAEAAAAYRRSLQRQPGHALALYDLARLRWRLGDSDFDAELKLATSADPASAVAPGIHARLLWRGERYEDAACAYACAIERDPQAAELRDGLARCLSRQGHFGSSVLEHDRALALAPRDAHLRTSLATTLLMAGQPVPAQVQAEIACELAPDDQHAIAVLGLAWRLNADPREPWLNDVGRLVEVHELAPPRGFADLESFHAALVLELAALHLDHAAPLDQTLRHGTQTQGDIFEQGQCAQGAHQPGRRRLHRPAAARREPSVPAPASQGLALHRLLVLQAGEGRFSYQPCAPSRLDQLGLLRRRARQHARHNALRGLAAVWRARFRDGPGQCRAQACAAACRPAGVVPLDVLAWHLAHPGAGHPADHRL